MLSTTATITRVVKRGFSIIYCIFLLLAGGRSRAEQVKKYAPAEECC
jgi:hypothetical protein